MLTFWPPMIAPRAPPASGAEGEQVTVRDTALAVQSNAASECPGVAARGSMVATAVGWLSEQAAARDMAPIAASVESRAGVNRPAGTRGIRDPSRGWMDGERFAAVVTDELLHERSGEIGRAGRAPRSFQPDCPALRSGREHRVLRLGGAAAAGAENRGHQGAPPVASVHVAV